jgi:hypothetical protein
VIPGVKQKLLVFLVAALSCRIGLCGQVVVNAGSPGETSNLSAIVSYTWSKLLGNTVDVTTGAFNANGTPGVQDFYRLDLERSVQPTDIPHGCAAVPA